MDFQNIILSDIFLKKFHIKTIINLQKCCKKLYDGLHEEYYDALNDVNIYTWSRNYKMKIYVWGRGWVKEIIKNLYPDNVIEYIPIYQEYKICGSSVNYNNYANHTKITCNELLYDDDKILELFHETYDYYNLVIGKETKQPEKNVCPEKIANYF